MKFSFSQIRPRQRLLQLRQIHQPGLVALRLGPGGVRKPGAGKKTQNAPLRARADHRGLLHQFTNDRLPNRVFAPSALPQQQRFFTPTATTSTCASPNDCPPFPKRRGLRAWVITHRRHHAREHPQSPDGPPHARLGGRGRDALHRVGCRGACGEW